MASPFWFFATLTCASDTWKNLKIYRSGAGMNYPEILTKMTLSWKTVRSPARHLPALGRINGWRLIRERRILLRAAAHSAPGFAGYAGPGDRADADWPRAAIPRGNRPARSKGVGGNRQHRSAFVFSCVVPRWRGRHESVAPKRADLLARWVFRGLPVGHPRTGTHTLGRSTGEAALHPEPAPGAGDYALGDSPAGLRILAALARMATRRG